MGKNKNITFSMFEFSPLIQGTKCTIGSWQFLNYKWKWSTIIFNNLFSAWESPVVLSLALSQTPFWGCENST